MTDPITTAIIKAVEERQAAVKRQLEVAAAAKIVSDRITKERKERSPT